MNMENDLLGHRYRSPLSPGYDSYSAQVKYFVTSLNIGGWTKHNFSNGTVINIIGRVIFLASLDVGTKMNFPVAVVINFDSSYEFTWAGID